MKKILSVFLVISMLLTISLTMASCSKEEPIAIINGDPIYMYDIEDDLTLMSAIEKVDINDTKAYNKLIYDVLNAYVMDYICNKELEALGLTYKSEYYAASYESLVEAYGSESNLIKSMKSMGLDRQYIENLCRKQAKKSTIVEYFVSTLKVSEEELLTYYIENSKEFSQEDLRHISSLYFTTKDEALAALEKIKEIGFDNYYQLQDIEETCLFHVKFDYVAKDDFPTETANAIWALEVGQYSEPIVCSVGYTIIKIDEKIDQHTYSYEEIKDAIEEVLIDEKTDEYLEKYFVELQEKYNVEVLMEGPQ